MNIKLHVNKILIDNKIFYIQFSATRKELEDTKTTFDSMRIELVDKWKNLKEELKGIKAEFFGNNAIFHLTKWKF
jgi:hypothetical protein